MHSTTAAAAAVALDKNVHTSARARTFGYKTKGILVCVFMCVRVCVCASMLTVGLSVSVVFYVCVLHSKRNLLLLREKGAEQVKCTQVCLRVRRMRVLRVQFRSMLVLILGASARRINENAHVDSSHCRRCDSHSSQRIT